MTQKIAPTLTWEENEKGTLIGTATLDDGRVVQYACRNKGDDDNPKWVHFRSISRQRSDGDFGGEIEMDVKFKINGGEDAQTRMRSIHLCMKDLIELSKTL
nr:MAG TPA: hypothetical protein [Caudoviricetes sp.]